jgi:hypothetical protein
MKKGYIFTTVAVILVIVGLMAIIGSTLSSADIPIKDGYKQYTNNEYGFKFQYPADFVLRGISEEGTKNLGIALVSSSTATISSTSSPISTIQLQKTLKTMRPIMFLLNICSRVLKV